MVDRSR